MRKAPLCNLTTLTTLTTLTILATTLPLYANNSILHNSEDDFQLASFVDPALAAYQLIKPRHVEGISGCTIVENIDGLEHPSPMTLQGSCQSSFVWPKVWYKDDLGHVPEPEMRQAGCFQYTLESRQAEERDLDGKSIGWSFVYHLRAVYRLDGLPLPCADPNEHLSFGWPADVTLARTKIRQGTASIEIPQETPLPRLQATDVSHGYESTSGATFSLFAGLWKQRTAVIVLDVHWNQTLFSFDRVWGMSSESGPSTVFQLLIEPLNKAPKEASYLRICPSSRGCQPGFIFGGTSVAWRDHQLQPSFWQASGRD